MNFEQSTKLISILETQAPQSIGRNTGKQFTARKLKFLWDSSEAKLFPKRKTFSQRKLINCLFNNRPYMFCWFSTAGEIPWKTINSRSVMKIHFLLLLWHLPTVQFIVCAKQQSSWFVNKINRRKNCPPKGNQRETNWILANFLIKFSSKFRFVTVSGWHLWKLIDLSKAVLCNWCDCAD